ncbi:hypothetical protein ZIOFF_040079 [Zingiber officinale]|uniref:Uncharacterized protein n=1 Tax=Zingiber officinale TaxID=94328 RepID=A0A8J5G5Q4_ZINOF|nr:hypothetical protein ZIOFF_040079 [Zingiber officinale]
MNLNIIFQGERTVKIDGQQGQSGDVWQRRKDTKGKSNLYASCDICEVLVKELGVDGVLIDKFHVTISLGSPDSLVFASAFCIDGVRLAVEFCLMICLTEMLFDGMSCALSFSVELGLGVGSCEVFKSILWMFRFLLGYLKTSDGIADLCFVFVPSAVPIDCCSILQTEVVLGMDNVD